MPDWLAVIILGIIEGLTEFLPISSTGHLLIPQNLGWLPKQGEVFDVVIQGGAVSAVLVVFAKRLRAMLASLREPATQRYLSQLAAAFVLTAIGGLLAKKLHWKLPEAVAPVAWATLIGGVVILWAERRLSGGGPTRQEISWAVVVVVALAQVLAAVFPGTSRSGACILAAMLMGVQRPAATEFSFLLGVPTLLAAGGLELVSAGMQEGFSHLHWGQLLLGSLVSALSAFVVVRWLVGFVQRHDFRGFAWYRIVLGLLLLWQASR
jgi:undecaprenyl-diphosphatase